MVYWYENYTIFSPGGGRFESELTVALNIKNEEVERLAREVSEMTGESKTEAIRRALSERHARQRAAAGGSAGERLRRFLEDELWPQIPDSERGRRMTRDKEDEILGYGPGGV